MDEQVTQLWEVVVKDGAPWRDLSRRIVQAALEVHDTLGPGFDDGVYREALAYELERRAIPFKRQSRVMVQYKGRVVGAYRLDFVVDDKVVLELKTVLELSDTLKRQTLSHLRATGLRVGILVNFGASPIQYVRIVG